MRLQEVNSKQQNYFLILSWKLKHSSIQANKENLKIRSCKEIVQSVFVDAMQGRTFFSYASPLFQQAYLSRP